MRDIIFRGKRADTGDWVEGQYYKQNFCYGDTSVRYYIITSTETLDYDQALDYYMIIPKTIGEYFGYEDKHGKKIFTGDFIKAHHRLWNEPVLGLVTYEYDGFGCRMHKNAELTAHLSNFDDVEVIGNIYDNPELLDLLEEK